MEIPEDRTERLEPLNPKHHVEGAERQVVTIDDEWLTDDGDGEIIAAPRVWQSIVIGHHHPKAHAAVELNPDAFCRDDVDEIVDRPRVEEHHEVGEFCNRVMAPSCYDHSLTEPQQIQLFTTGLGEPVCTYVALQQPTLLDKDVMFTPFYEQCSMGPTAPVSIVSKTSQCSTNKAWSLATTAPTTSVVGSSVSTPSIQSSLSKKLSPTEIVDHQAKGLYFHCDNDL
jgi:hypothetical protein